MRRKLFPISIVLLAFVLRVHRLGDQNIWWDEGYSIWAARKDIVSIALMEARDVHPPLYLLIFHFWIKLVGTSEFAARFLSLICGVLTIALVYKVAGKLLDRRVGLLSSFLLSCARFHVWWSQEMRMYILATFFSLLSLYYFFKIVRDKGWLPYVLATTAALYTLYLSALVVLIENLLLLVRTFRKQEVRILKWTLSQASVIILFAPWLYLAITKMRAGVAESLFPFRLLPQLYLLLLSTGISTHIERYLWLTTIYLFISLAGLVLLFLQKRWEASLLLSLTLLLPPIIIYLLSLPRGFFYCPKPEARYFLLLAPMFYMLLASSIILIWDRKRLLGVLASTLVVITFGFALREHYRGRYIRDELQTAVRIISAYSEQDDAVLLVSGDRYPVFLYYYDRQFELLSRPVVYQLPRNSNIVTEENVGSELGEIVARHPRIWLALVESSLQDPEGLVERWMDERYEKPLSFAFAHNKLSLYTAEQIKPSVIPDNLDIQYPLYLSLGGNELLGYDLPSFEHRPGDTAHLALYLLIHQDARVTIDLVDEMGRALERREITMKAEEEILRLQVDFRIFSRTPSGLYHFELRHMDEKVSFGKLLITHTEPLPPIGKISEPMEVNLGDKVIFLGYDLMDDKFCPGDVLKLNLYWKAKRKFGEDYTVFTHLLGRAYNPSTGGPIWGQMDSQPLGGGYPTSQWTVGRVIKDSYEIPIDPEAPPGIYQIEVGMYLLSTGERLPVLGPEGVLGDRILLKSVEVILCEKLAKRS
jgi:hypothetical protein